MAMTLARQMAASGYTARMPEPLPKQRVLPKTSYLKKVVWLPFVFALLLEGIQLATGSQGTSAFLPMCFFFAAAAQFGTLLRIEQLEDKLRSMNGEDAGSAR